MSGEPELTNVTSGPSRAAALDALPDRAARNPFYRYLMHLGLPVTFSVIVHVGILLFLGMKTFAVTTRAPVEVGEYEASLTESMAEKMKDAFQWADAEVLPAPDDMTPEPSFDSLTSLRDVPDFDARDLAAGAGATGVGDGSGLGIGDGALTLLGTGSGAGEAGTGGLGSGLGGGGARIGQAGIRVGQYSVLTIIEHNPGLSQTQVAGYSATKALSESQPAAGPSGIECHR